MGNFCKLAEIMLRGSAKTYAVMSKAVRVHRPVRCTARRNTSPLCSTISKTAKCALIICFKNRSKSIRTMLSHASPTFMLASMPHAIGVQYIWNPSTRSMVLMGMLSLHNLLGHAIRRISRAVCMGARSSSLRANQAGRAQILTNCYASTVLDTHRDG